MTPEPGCGSGQSDLPLDLAGAAPQLLQAWFTARVPKGDVDTILLFDSGAATNLNGSAIRSLVERVSAGVDHIADLQARVLVASRLVVISDDYAGAAAGPLQRHCRGLLASTITAALRAGVDWRRVCWPGAFAVFGYAERQGLLESEAQSFSLDEAEGSTTAAAHRQRLALFRLALRGECRRAVHTAGKLEAIIESRLRTARGQERFDWNQIRFFDHVFAGRDAAAYDAWEGMKDSLDECPQEHRYLPIAVSVLLWLRSRIAAGQMPRGPEWRHMLDEAGLGSLPVGTPAAGFTSQLHNLFALVSGDWGRRGPGDFTAAEGHGLLCGPMELFELIPVYRFLAYGQTDWAAEVLERRERIGYDTLAGRFIRARISAQRGEDGLARRFLAETLARAEAWDMQGVLDFHFRLAPEFGPGRASVLLASSERVERADAGATAERTVLIGSSPAMVQVRERIDRFARFDLPVLVVGPTGVGKELVASELHHRSPRSHEPLVTVNCAAVSESLLESELFGCVAGAFTGAERDRTGLVAHAGGGSLFLDEIGEAPPRLQAALLRLVEQGEYRRVGSDVVQRSRCRFIFATNADIAGRDFRSDLSHRIQSLRIDVPGLEARREDIPALVDHFLVTRWQPFDGMQRQVDLAAQVALAAQPWPGNVRELRNAVDRAVAMAPHAPVLQSENFAIEGRSGNQTGPTTAAYDRPSDDPPAARQPVDRRDAIAAWIGKRGRASRREVMDRFGCSAATASRDLQALARDGLIRRVEPTPAPRSFYFVPVASDD